MGRSGKHSALATLERVNLFEFRFEILTLNVIRDEKVCLLLLE